MIFVLAKDDLGLSAYATEREAVSACEGVDVEDGNYQFFDAVGSPLSPKFLTPNQRGTVLIRSGEYMLEPVTGDVMPDLLSQLNRVAYVEGCGIHSTEEIRAALSQARRTKAGSTG